MCLQTLTTLNLCQNGIGAEGIKHLAKALENNNVNMTFMFFLFYYKSFIQTLIRLHLAENSIGIEGSAYLAKAFENNNVSFSLWMKVFCL